LQAVSWAAVPRRPLRRILAVLALLATSAAVLYRQESDLRSTPARFEVLRHLEWLEGRSYLFNPWQYRVLPDLAIEATVRAFGLVPAWRERAEVRYRPRAPLERRIQANGWALLPYRTLRVLLVAAVFASLLQWLTRVGVRDATARWLGVALLAYAMGEAHFDSGMAFSSYVDLWLYLLAALAITGGRPAAILPLSLLAATNRETGALIPVMLAAVAIDWRARRVRDRAALAWAAGSLLAFFAVFAAIRSFYGWQPPSPVYGNREVADFVRVNLTDRFTLPELAATYLFLPVLALFGWRRWTPELRVWLWCILPVWLLVHVGHGFLRETRLLLVPYALLAIPGLLLGIGGARDGTRGAQPG
jgi:hypothetical protein